MIQISWIDAFASAVAVLKIQTDLISNVIGWVFPTETWNAWLIKFEGSGTLKTSILLERVVWLTN